MGNVLKRQQPDEKEENIPSPQIGLQHNKKYQVYRNHKVEYKHTGMRQSSVRHHELDTGEENVLKLSSYSLSLYNKVISVDMTFEFPTVQVPTYSYASEHKRKRNVVTLTYLYQLL